MVQNLDSGLENRLNFRDVIITKATLNIIFCVSEGFPNTVEGDNDQKINKHQVNEIHDYK